MIRHLSLISLIALLMNNAMASEAPRYKASSRAEPTDISTNAYGASSLAPEALGIAEPAPDFVLPRSGGGEYRLSQAAQAGPVVLVFYRGHW